MEENKDLLSEVEARQESEAEVVTEITPQLNGEDKTAAEVTPRFSDTNVTAVEAVVRRSSTNEIHTEVTIAAVPTSIEESTDALVEVRKSNSIAVDIELDVTEKPIVLSNGQNDVLTEITIAPRTQDEANDVPSEVVVQRHAIDETEVELEVLEPQLNDMHNDIDVEVTPRIRVSTTADIETEMEVHAYVMKDAPIEFIVQRSSQEDAAAEITIQGYGSAALTTELLVQRHSQSETEMELVVSTPNTRSDKETAVTIPAHNWAYGAYNLMMPPSVNVRLEAVRDAFARKEEGYTRLNYGEASTIQLKKVGDLESETFVGFDISSLDPAMAYTEAFIELSYSGIIPEGTELALNAVREAWGELSLTWENRPSNEPLVYDNFVIDEANNKIRYYITNYLKKWVVGAVENEGFRIYYGANSSEGAVFMRSRENKEKAFRPVLSVTYVDPNIKNVGRKNVDVELNVLQKSTSRIYTVVEPSAVFSSKLLPTELYVHQVDVPLESDILTEVTISKPFVETKMVVRRSATVVGDVEVTPRLKTIRERSAEFTVSRKQTDAEIYVFHRAGTDAEIEVRQRTTNTMPIEFAVSRLATDVVLTARQTVKNVPVEDLVFHGGVDAEGNPLPRPAGAGGATLVEVTASRKQMLASIEVLSPTLMSDRMVVLNVDAMAKSNTDAEISVVRPATDVEVEPRLARHSSVDTEVIVSKRFIGAEVFVTRPTTYVEFISKALRQSDVETEVTAIRKENYVEVTVPYDGVSDIETEILPRVLRASDIETYIEVMSSDEATLETEVAATRTGILTEFYPRVPAISVTEAEITVASKGAYAFIM